MGERWDLVRSVVRRAAEGARAQAGRSVLADLGRAAASIVGRRAEIPERTLQAAALALPDLRVASLRCEPGQIAFDLELEGGRAVQGTLSPERPAFAHGGAKEVMFRVAPASLAHDATVRALCGALGAVIARALWTSALPAALDRDEPGLTEVEADVVRVDLRTVPAVRATLARTPAAQRLVELIALEAIEPVPKGLSLRLALPDLRR